MVSTPSGLIIADRNDIHKSCTTLELVANILNDYCEAANAVVQLEKKLAKALKEVASNKCTTEIPAKVLNASATMFETLVEVDTKFAKFSGHQCDDISKEVKKWFKRLAKEERAHDDRIAEANAKIKQAGIAFEKKSKKSPQGAPEEHTRYMNLLSTLGSEVNQYKYNFGLAVTQKQISTLYSLANHVSRIADAEWQRACESVRRFSPTVGHLGEWRAHCEGGWSSTIPDDLPDLDEQAGELEARQEYDFDNLDRGSRDHNVPAAKRTVPEYSSRAVTPSGQPSPPRYVSSVEDPSAQNPPVSEKVIDPIERQRRHQSTTPFAALASFPSPPTHFPIPDVNDTRAEGNRNSGSEFSSSSGPIPTHPLSESPTPESISQTPALTEGSLSPAARHEPLTPSASIPNSTQLAVAISRDGGDSTYSELTNPHSNLSVVDNNETAQSEDNGDDQQNTSQNADETNDGEFGARRDENPVPQFSPQNAVVTRNDTTRSSGSVVATLRDRYTRPTQPSSPPPRSLPRLPTNVASLAGMYEPVVDTTMLPRQTPISPTDERRRISLDNYGRSAETPSIGYGPRYASSSPRASPLVGEADALRKRRLREFGEIEYREHQRELRWREHEIEQQARQLERERMHLMNLRNVGAKPDGYTSDSSSRASAAARAAALSQRPRYDPTSSPYLHQTPYSSYQAHLDSPLETSLDQRPTSANSHPPRFADPSPSPSPRDVRAPELPAALRPEKPKGWIRRLSMPVMNTAFLSDSKKGLGIAGSVGFRSSQDLPGEDGRLRDLLGGIRNRSATSLARR